MQLSRLVITGFKSFVEKTDLSFQAGITAIVGPNGCGKSNIADAIRWALGEQSAKLLRAERMEDVIFAGSRERKPLGMAEVSLTLTRANSRLPTEFEEINITRCLYRSGDSEYFLNKAPCRLKDIAELFLDTGLGAEPYALIEQGSVASIVNGRPSERRALLEEAAGVTKYKGRRKVTLSKLDSTEQNLLRIRDVIAEVERGLLSLRRQTRKAERYRELKGRADQLQLLLKHREYLSLMEGLAREGEGFQGLQREQSQLVAQIARMEASLEAERLAEISSQRALSQAESELFKLRRRIDKVEAELRMRRLSLQNLIEKAQQGVGKQESVIIRSRQLQEQLESEREKYRGLQGELAIKEEAVRINSARLLIVAQRLKEIEGELEEHRGRSFSLASALTEKRNQLLNLKEQRLSFERSREKLAKGFEAAKAERETLEKRRQQVTSKLAHIERELVTLLSEKEEVSALLAKEEEFQNGLDMKLVALREGLSRSRSRLESYRELHDNCYQSGSGLPLKGLASIENLPSLDELLEVEERYEKALEALLDRDLRGMIIKDLAAALAFLQAQNGAQALLIPLELPFPPEPDPSPAHLPHAPRLEGRAVDFVRCLPQYRALLERLLGDGLIVEDLESAFYLVSHGLWKGRIATLQGGLIDPRGTIRLGSLEAGGLLARQREMRTLAEEIAQMEVGLAHWEREQEEGRSRMDQLKEGVERLEKGLQALQKEQVQGEKEGVQLDAEARRLEGQLELFTFELSELEKELSGNSQAMEMVEREIALLEEGLRDEEEKGRLLQRDLAEINPQKDGLASIITELRLEMATLRERLEGTQAQMARMETELGGLLSEEACLAEDLSLWETRRDEEERSLALLESDLAGLLKEEEKARLTLASLEGEHGLIQERVRSLEDELRQGRKEAAGLQERTSAFQVRMAELTQSLRHLREEGLEDYQVDLETFSPERETADPQTWRAELEDLNKQIHEMGPVNLAALEEYRSLKERHDFLSRHAADLEASIKSLKEAITEINRTSQALFQETFAVVEAHFDRYFRHFFSGGRAKLVLQSDEEKEEPGVEILVRPPGKKLGNLSLLSGGEKAMTGLAFLLGLFTANPSPFCLLDEVDAPLDDANIERFLSLLQELKSSSQFIIITHNKRTMEAADLLYGITMEEPGVSKLVSVRFNTPDQ